MRRQVEGMITALVLTVSGAQAQTTAPGTAPLIEREPPVATQPVAPAPVTVPQTTGVPIPATAPAPVPPVAVPPGPGPVAVPAPIAPGPVTTPATPAIQGSSAPTTPAAEAPKPAAPAEAAAPAAPSEAAKPETPAAPPAASAPAPAAPPATAQPTPAAPAPEKYVAEEVTVAPRPALFITGVTTWEKAEEQLGGVFAKLGEATAKLGVAKHDSPLVEYIESDSEDVGYRVLVPVEALPKGKLPKGVKSGESPAGKALKFRHDGPIEDLEEVYARIDDEVTKRGVDVRSIVEQYDEDALASPEDRVVVDVWVFLK